NGQLANYQQLRDELLADGKQIDPKHIKMMPAAKLTGTELQRFTANKDLIEKRLENLRDPLAAPTEVLAQNASLARENINKAA
ncbi:MAG: hypothetical protein NWR43_00110, partial [Alphaproteobacteria bacterium]|nr:hypothetical protein [Alphaproteobacteria bacterium]